MPRTKILAIILQRKERSSWLIDYMQVLAIKVLQVQVIQQSERS